MYQPELYDAVTPAPFRGGAEWYRRKAQDSGGPVLELGAGTGRITLAMAQDGVSIHALDADAAMLDRLRRKLTLEVQQRVLVRVDDMRTFAAAERFPLIIPAFRAFTAPVQKRDRAAAWAECPVRR